MRKEGGASNIHNMPRQHAQRFIRSGGANVLLSTIRKEREVHEDRGRATQHSPCHWALCEQRMGDSEARSDPLSLQSRAMISHV